MNLLSPWSLLWFVPPAAAIIFLYLLKLKRLPHTVSSVLLWERLVADLQANAPFQKLKRSLLLLLQLLALAVMVIALARPFVHAPGLEGQSIVLIMDASASMKATDVSGTRFGEAQRIARRAVDDLGRDDTMTVITASTRTRVLCPFTSDKRTLANAINSLECSDSTTHLEDAVRLADSLCARRKKAQIVLLSDGAFPALPNPVESHARLTFTQIGRRADNVAIITLDARRSLSGSGGYQVFVAMQNFSPATKTFTLELLCQEKLADAREQTIAAGRQKAEVFELPAGASGSVTARLDLSDDLEADNTATTFLTSRRQVSVLLITKGDLFLERALAVDPSLDVYKVAAPPRTSRSYDLVVIEGAEVPHPPLAGGYLFINTSGELAPVTPTGKVSNPSIVDWERNDPVTRHLDFSNVRIAAARTASLKSWGRALVEAEGQPLLTAGERGGVRSVYVGWDLLNSDFPLRVAFPIFVANCVDWLIRTPAAVEEVAVRPGEVVSLNVPTGLRSARVTDPSGRKAYVSTNQSALLVENTESAGIYTVQGSGLRRRFAVNLLSRVESNTRPAAQVELGGRRLAGGRGTVQTNKELWRWLILAALALVTLEWFAYHRRP